MFQDYLRENSELFEKLITFGGRAYPKFGNIVILAGGAASGKGMQLKNLLGIQGKTFDVDELKKLALRSNKFAGRVKEETGYDLAKFNLKNPENVSKVHEILSDVYNVTGKHQQAAFASILTSDPRRKPNLIFDVTLKDMKKLMDISRNAEELGYEKQNIHLVWVVNELEIAMKQNRERDRVVPEEILIGTHQGAALTMKRVLDMGDKLKQYMDGDVWLSFNRFKANKPEETDLGLKKSKHGGQYVETADYIRVKAKGRTQLSSSQLKDSVYNKIKSYVPEVDSW